jgi:hypothetical protein
VTAPSGSSALFLGVIGPGGAVRVIPLASGAEPGWSRGPFVPGRWSGSLGTMWFLGPEDPTWTEVTLPSGSAP